METECDDNDHDDDDDDDGGSIFVGSNQLSVLPRHASTVSTSSIREVIRIGSLDYRHRHQGAINRRRRVR